jgi:hypothetical protein
VKIWRLKTVETVFMAGGATEVGGAIRCRDRAIWPCFGYVVLILCSQVSHAQMNFKNKAKKLTQATARLIERSGGPVDYLRLSKLIYLADRESILKRGIPIVGGNYFSMRKGPIISEFMNAVGRRDAPGWAETISARYGNEIRLEGVPSYSALSESELSILDLTVAQHAQQTTDELVAWCHDNCPEYEEVNPAERKPIKVESILKSCHKSAKAIQKVLDDAREIEELDALLS